MNKQEIDWIISIIKSGLSERIESLFDTAIQEYFGEEIHEQLVNDEHPDWQIYIVIYCLKKASEIYLECYEETKCRASDTFDLKKQNYPICKTCELSKKKICQKCNRHIVYLLKIALMALIQECDFDSFVDWIIAPIFKKYDDHY